MAKLLTVEHLHAGYGPIEVLKDISLEVNEGEIVTMIGANGAGKTTTLMTISPSFTSSEMSFNTSIGP